MSRAPILSLSWILTASVLLPSPAVPEVKAASCAAISVLVMGVLSCIGLLLASLTGPLIAGIGGILGTIGSSIVICCGPPTTGGGAGKMQACMYLCAIGCLLEIGGAAVGIALFFGWKANIETGCAVYGNSGPSYDSCVNGLVGLVGALVWPSVGISFGAGAAMIDCALKSKKAVAALSGKVAAVGAA